MGRHYHRSVSYTHLELLRKGCGDPDAWAQEYELQWLDESTAWLPFSLITDAEDDEAGNPSHSCGGPCFIGVDIGRRRDLFVIWVLEKVGDVLWTREVIERRGATFAEQDALLDDVFARYNVARCCMDQPGMEMCIRDRCGIGMRKRSRYDGG